MPVALIQNCEIPSCTTIALRRKRAQLAKLLFFVKPKSLFPPFWNMQNVPAWCIHELKATKSLVALLCKASLIPCTHIWQREDGVQGARGVTASQNSVINIRRLYTVPEKKQDFKIRVVAQCVW
jgi:hypothetical protein